ncbi:MAG: hypothetical protein EBU85_08075, partial [Actinobacteria bacterium]|nr:hypothetical protein [Actinomycetota bacterium]
MVSSFVYWTFSLAICARRDAQIFATRKKMEQAVFRRLQADSSTVQADSPPLQIQACSPPLISPRTPQCTAAASTEQASSSSAQARASAQAARAIAAQLEQAFSRTSVIANSSPTLPDIFHGAEGVDGARSCPETSPEMRERRDDFVSESHVRRTRLMRPFIEWLSNVARVAQVHDQLESITAKVINRRLWPAWSLWVEHSASRTRSESLGRLVAIKLEALALLRALNAWAEMPCSNAATSWRVSKADSHLMLRHTSRAWNTWAACVAQHCLCALAYGSALRALRHRFIEIGWLAWQDYVANRGFRALRIRRLEVLSRMERTVAHIYHRSVAPAWQTWAVYRSSRAAF